MSRIGDFERIMRHEQPEYLLPDTEGRLPADMAAVRGGGCLGSVSCRFRQSK